MNILHKLHQALINAGWIRGADREVTSEDIRDAVYRAHVAFLSRSVLVVNEHGVREPLNDEWQSDSFFSGPVGKAKLLAGIARQRTELKEQLEKAKRQKRPRKHIYAALAELTEAELRIESGK